LLVGDDRERTEKTVTALYNRLLLRSPDVAGLESYANQLETGEIDFETLIDRFLESKEFRTNLGAFEMRYADPENTRFTKDHSQYGEIDLIIKNVMNRHAKHKIVVDVGVRGKEGSNSYDLMKYFGWTGLLIEANPDLVPSIAAEFAGLDMTFVSTAVSDYEGHAEFFLGSNDAISSLNKGATEGWGPITGSVRVQVRRLRDILVERQIPIDFDILSLDIEGEDIKVLNDLIDNSDYRPEWIIIEASYDFQTKSMNDLPFSAAVIDNYSISEQTVANLILKYRR